MKLDVNLPKKKVSDCSRLLTLSLKKCFCNLPLFPYYYYDKCDIKCGVSVTLPHMHFGIIIYILHITY